MSSVPLMTAAELNRLAIERTVTAVDPLRTPPTRVDNISATSRTFGILVQWSRVDGCDGYIVLVSDNGDFDSPIDQVRVVGDSNLSYTYNTGNVAVLRYFAVSAYSGSIVADKSDVVSATSGNVETGASQTDSPVATTFDNVETTLLTAVLTTTGRNVFIIARGRINNPAAKAYDLKLKEDGTLIDTATGFSTDEIESTLFALRTPAAGSHTYTMTGQNTSDATVLSVDDLKMVVYEVPFSTSVEAASTPSEPPAAPQSPPQTDYIPTGPGYTWNR